MDSGKLRWWAKGGDVGFKLLELLNEKGIPLTNSLGLAVCLPLLVVGLLVSMVFGCSLCLVLAEVVRKAMADGFIGTELLSDLRVSFIAFMIGSLMTWASLNIVRSFRGGTRGSA
jgi:hypothetical protein